MAPTTKPGTSLQDLILTLHRFWSMVAHYHGQIWNGAEPARSLGIGETSVRRYLDLLTNLQALGLSQARQIAAVALILQIGQVAQALADGDKVGEQIGRAHV